MSQFNFKQRIISLGLGGYMLVTGAGALGETTPEIESSDKKPAAEWNLDEAYNTAAREEAVTALMADCKIAGEANGHINYDFLCEDNFIALEILLNMETITDNYYQYGRIPERYSKIWALGLDRITELANTLISYINTANRDQDVINALGGRRISLTGLYATNLTEGEKRYFTQVDQAMNTLCARWPEVNIANSTMLLDDESYQAFYNMITYLVQAKQLRPELKRYMDYILREMVGYLAKDRNLFFEELTKLYRQDPNLMDEFFETVKEIITVNEGKLELNPDCAVILSQCDKNATALYYTIDFATNSFGCR